MEAWPIGCPHTGLALLGPIQALRAVACVRFTRLKRPCKGTVNTETDLQPSSMTAHEPKARAANGANEPLTDFTGHGTILLVEDEDGLRSLIARGLRSRGYSVIEASNGFKALEALEEKNGPVDLVVSDVVMPEMDGPTLLKTMRRNQELKIIFISGYAEDAFEKSLPEKQQFAFLPKPFTLGQLVRAVKETMLPP
jgi:two-component system, cell cycle sensor histidine kinase and response regulator CckA